MKIRRKVEIEVQHNRSWLVQNGRRTVFADCIVCGSGSRMLTVAEAEQVEEYSGREIYRLIEAGRLHFIETPAGQVYVCSQSLAAVTELNI